MALSKDVLPKNKSGVGGHLRGKTAEQIYRAHHNLDQVTGELLPGFVEHIAGGCECDDCQGYLTLAGKQTENEPEAA
jgi:hypothetical protein